MSSYTDVKNLIISNIKANGQREITGPILQDVLLNMLENSSSIEEITYSDLKALRDGSKLTPSRLYRITDYITTTVQSNTKSAGHPFDVIVLALSETELSEQAWAIQHEGDTYFDNSNLSAWQIWYCIDNDTNRFAWADGTNGKGVIYRMIDEFNNDCPYDFKNIQFKHPKDTTTHPDYYYYYTFTSNNVGSSTDYSLSIVNNCYSNVIKEYITSGKRTLNQIIFIGNNCYSNSFGSNCYNSAFGANCHNNTIGDNCYNNIFGDSCYYNTFGNYNRDNTFGSNYYNNTIGNSCTYNTFGTNCRNNIIGNNYYFNTLGNDCYSNTFKNNCNNNSFGTNCSFNSFGNQCAYIKFASSSSSTTKYNYYKNNHFGDGCQYIFFKGAETASSSAQAQNYKFAQGTSGTPSAYLTIDGARNRSYETYISKDTDGTIKESVISEKLDNIIEITYTELVALRDSSNLIPGQQYRIADYQCTTTQKNTKSAGHVFDIIVTADSESILSEEARAIKHKDDTYFADCDLNAWHIWYCLDNDTTCFAWADGTNGKGVIYRMIDEWNNDIPYDFKNIQFKHPLDTTTYYYYTFASSNIENNTDNSLNMEKYCHSNVIREYINLGKRTLNNIIFISGNCHNNTFGTNCYNNSFGSSCYYNSFGFSCWYNSFGSNCYSNTFGSYCYKNTFGSSCSENTFGPSCTDNSFDFKCYSNTFGPSCSNNSFGSGCFSNTFDSYCKENSVGSDCSSNSLGSDCSSNSFSAECHNNTLGPNCLNNSFVSYCDSNSFGSGCHHNSFNSDCYNNTFGSYCHSNSFGTGCDNNSFASYDNNVVLNSDCRNNSFGSNCSYIKFASDKSATTKYNYYQNNHFGGGCQYILFKGAETASSSAQVQNYNFSQGLQGTADTYLTIDGKRNRSYETYISIDTDGTIKESIIADNTNNITTLTTNLSNEISARTQADTELQTQINSKQEALTLTVKDNGNIVLANIQGQSKEFMPATPSGDPMHYAYVAAGAEYNDTGADIIKTAPWADLADDDVDKTVIHKAGYWYLNGLGDLTNNDMLNIMYTNMPFSYALYAGSAHKFRTNLCFEDNNPFIFVGRGNCAALIRDNANIKVLRLPISGNYDYKPNTANELCLGSRVIHITNILNGENISNYSRSFDCRFLRTIKIKSLKCDISFSMVSGLTLKSILYMINNEAATSPITITLHADVYNKCMANADILAALETHINISLASA